MTRSSPATLHWARNGLVLALLVAAAPARPALAALQCEPVRATKTTSVLFDLPKYFAVSTPDADTIDSACSQEWQNPADNWRYGDYNFLYKNNGYTKSERTKASATRSPDYYLSQMHRYSCTSDDSGRPEHVGWFAFSQVPGRSQVELSFLCTAPSARGRGYGQEMMNTALSEAHPVDGRNSLKLIALNAKNTLAFYNSLNMSCSQETEQGVTASIYQTATQAHGSTIARRPRFVSEARLGNGGSACAPIAYSCLDQSTVDSCIAKAHEIDTQMFPATCPNPGKAVNFVAFCHEVDETHGGH